MLRTFLATITLAAPAITVVLLPSHAQSAPPMADTATPAAAAGVPGLVSKL